MLPWITFAHRVMDNVIVDAQTRRPEDPDGRRETVMEGTALDVRVVP